MNSGENGNCFKKAMFILVSVIFGVVMGYLFPAHFLFARTTFLITLCLSAILWFILLLTNMVVNSNCRCRKKKENLLLFWGNIGLILTSFIGIAVADVHTTIHAVLFGVNCALFIYVLLFSYFYISVCEHRCREKNQNFDEESQ